MKPLLFFLVAVFSTSLGIAQTNRIASILKDKKSDSPIMGGNIFLKNKDSTIAKMTVSDDNGTWSFENITDGNYFLQIEAAGYEAYASEIFSVKADKNLQMAPVLLNQAPKVLAGVVVSARRPIIERKVDKMVVNVDASLTSAGTSVLEVLEKAPGVSVDKDGKVSLQGKEGVMVLIDDRPTYLKGSDLANYLRSLPSASVEQLEIMTNPSSKYEAAGNSGIINIKSKKIKKYGLNGNVNVSGMVTNVGRANSSLNLNYRKGKVNLFGTYSYSLFNNLSKQFILRNFRNPANKALISIFDQKGDNEYHSSDHNLKAGIDFYANDRTIAGIVISGSLKDETQIFHNKTYLLNGNREIDSSLTSLNRMHGNANNFSTNLNLRHSFDSSGKKMTADLDYIVYDLQSAMKFGTDYFLPDGTIQKPPAYLKARTPSRIYIYSAKTDFTFPLKKAGTIEAGVKSSYVSTDNDADYRNKVDGEFEMDNSKSNHFLYNENINAAYLNWNTQWAKWSVQAGLRAEHTYVKGHQLGNQVVPDSAFTKSYLNIFPTFYLSFQATESNSFGINFGRRISRPVYQDLNPFLYFLDEYTYQAGNVLLQPEFTNRIEFSYAYKNLLYSSVSYAHTEDAMMDVLKQNTAKRTTYQTKENIADKKSFVLNSGSNFSVGSNFKTTLDATLINQQFKGALGSGILDADSWMFIGKVNEQVKMGKGWNGELSGQYRSGGREGQITFDGQWRVDVAVQKSILKDKGSINFFVRDVFNSQMFRGYVQYEDIDLLIDNKRVNRTFGISFKYRFGKPLKNLKQYHSNAASEEQGRVKSE